MDTDRLDLIVPSLALDVRPEVGTEVPGEVDAVAVLLTTDTQPPAELGLDLAALARAGFTPTPGSTLALATASGPVRVAVGLGAGADVDAAAVRDAAAAFARAVPKASTLALELPASTATSVAQAAGAAVQGVLLARNRWSVAGTGTPEVQASRIVLVTDAASQDEARDGAEQGLVGARVNLLSRDLATCPAVFLTAEAMADVAVELGSRFGFEVEVHDKASLQELGCGGLLGVNRGSANEPRMVVLRYLPETDPTGHLALVGKGITYDSGGISLKPGDESHSQMKNDMTGAGDVLAAFTGLRALGCRAQVTGYLMCTDNMPSGSAMQLGDILTTRDGKTVEVLNTDAEGRLVMADGLALSVEAGADAIIDIATLTGACLRALGVRYAGVMGSEPDLVSQIITGGEAVDERVWEFPLVEAYRKELDSDVADIKNIGGINAGQITAALFLREFVGSTPWAHIDIAGTAQAPAEDRWIRRGPTGFGARLLTEVATSFVRPGQR